MDIVKKLMELFPLTTTAILSVLALTAFMLADKMINMAIQHAAEHVTDAIFRTLYGE